MDNRIPQTGEKRLSGFFSGRFEPLGVVVLTRYFSDSNWYFYVQGDPKKVELKARTDWSKMPLVPSKEEVILNAFNHPIRVTPETKVDRKDWIDER